MVNIVTTTSCRATTASRNTVAKTVSLLVKKSFVSQDYVDKQRSIYASCTYDHLCCTPNCPRCSKEVYTSRYEQLSSQLLTSARSEQKSYAVSMSSPQWIIKPPYDITQFIKDTRCFIFLLRSLPTAYTWNFTYDISLTSDYISPHMHGTVTTVGDTDMDHQLQNDLLLIADLVDVSIDLDVQRLTKSSSLSPLSFNEAARWSKYQHKMQHLSNQVRNPTDQQSGDITTLKAISSLLFCDIETVHSSTSSETALVGTNSYILSGKLLRSVTELSSIGLTGLAESIKAAFTLPVVNSFALRKLKNILVDSPESVSKIRDITNKYIFRDVTDATVKKLLILLLTVKADLANETTILNKIERCWPTKSNTGSAERFWNEWFLTLLA